MIRLLRIGYGTWDGPDIDCFCRVYLAGGCVALGGFGCFFWLSAVFFLLSVGGGVLFEKHVKLANSQVTKACAR